MSERVRIGVDVGGTFTDLVLVDERARRVVTGKLLTTPKAPGDAIICGIERLLRDAGVAPDEVHSVVHGTTLVANTIIERTGARVGLITTDGFRDTLEMGREIRYDLYDLFLEPSPTLVPRRLRRVVRERISSDGEVLLGLDAGEVARTARDLVDDEGVESIAVSFMNSYRNPIHEMEAGLVLQDTVPHIPYTLSSDVAPEIREFERTSTACANAYVQPLMRGYLTTLEEQLRGIGLTAILHVMLSGGGITSIAQARRYPIRLIESGPAAGAMAACHYARMTGVSDLISFDMGGTTAKMCLIEDCRPQRTHDFEAGRVRRFKKGSGVPLKVSVVDMIEIGAGGGSIASVDSMGLLKVGPRSAGSDPGPVCYRRGGTEPAVTDADLLLGLLNPDYFLGGEMALDRSFVADAVGEKLSGPLAMELMDVALGIHGVVNENMAAATRRYLAEKGKDPRRYSLVAFGGAGPGHADALARLLKIRHVIVPFGAGVTSALGFLVAPPAVDEVRSLVTGLDDIEWPVINRLFDDMESEAMTRLTEVGALRSEVHFERHADMRYIGQGFEIKVPIPCGTLSAGTREVLREAFYRTYQGLFDRRVEDVPVEALTWRVSARAPAPAVALRFGVPDARRAHARTGERQILVAGAGMVSATVWNRYALEAGDAFDGPAVVEERESTTVVGPGARVTVDEWLNLRIDIGAD